VGRGKNPGWALQVARLGAEQGCTEALFTLGDKPELRYPEAAAELAAMVRGGRVRLCRRRSRRLPVAGAPVGAGRLLTAATPPACRDASQQRPCWSLQTADRCHPTRLQGYSTTLDYVHAAAGAVMRETGLLPHINAGVMGREDFERLKNVSASQGGCCCCCSCGCDGCCWL